MDSLFAAGGDSVDDGVVGNSLLIVCLEAIPPYLDLAGAVVSKYLSLNDLSPNDPIATSLDKYLTEPPNGGDPNSLLAKLHQIDVSETEKRQEWHRLLGQWESFARARESEGDGTVSN